MNILVVIPARGGSKGIPRKNLRTLAGKPLIYYSIRSALGSKYQPDVYVSTDDGEIANISEKLGAKVVRRDPVHAQDHTTLDPVIYDAYQQAEAKESKKYDLIVTLQPTSPLLKVESLDTALERISCEGEVDTMISARDDTHLTWKRLDGQYFPNYQRRVNRQYLEPVYRETGGFLITRASVISTSNRIGTRVELHLLSGGEDIDIDTYEDWNLCEYYLKRKKILFVVSGSQVIGLGHVYNTLLIANDILNHSVEFLVDKQSELALSKIASKNYKVYMQREENILDDIFRICPDVVINDRLDSTPKYILALKKYGVSVINFEDLGAGAQHADLVVNAIYPEKEVLPRHYFGHEYFLLRDEFILSPVSVPQRHVRRVLLTFGGVDPNNYTLKVIDAIYDYCQQRDIEIAVLTGFGYTQLDTLEDYKNITVFQNSMAVAEHMSTADIVFTSAGRTTYEVASLHIPAIVLAQNERELTHFFASADNGFLNLGLGTQVSQVEIINAFSKLVDNCASRQYMSRLMARTDLASGRRRVLKLINDILEQV